MWAIIKTVTFVWKQLKTQEIRSKYTILCLRMWIWIRIQVYTIENAPIWTRWRIQLQLKYTSESKSQQKQYLLHEWNRCYVCASKKTSSNTNSDAEKCNFLLETKRTKAAHRIRSKYSSYKRIHVSNVILSISRKTERNTPIRKWHSSKAVSFESRCVCCFSVIFPPLFTICKVNLCTRNDFRFYIMHYLLCFGGFFATFIHRADYFPCRLVHTSKSV